MSSYLRPRRGKNATAVSQLGSNAPLKRGEVFFEVPDAGVGTGLGKIKMGDGSTAYANLPYFLEQLDLDNAKVAFTDSNTPDANPYTTNTTLATAIAPTASMKTIFTNLKQLLVNHNAQLTQLNNDNTKSYIATFGTTRGRGPIQDALEVDLTAPDAYLNYVGYIYSGMENKLNYPSRISWGIRTVIWYNSSYIAVKVVGSDADNKYAEWINKFDGYWSGWKYLYTSPVTLRDTTVVTSNKNYALAGGTINEYNKISFYVLASGAHILNEITVSEEYVVQGGYTRVYVNPSIYVDFHIHPTNHTIMIIEGNSDFISTGYSIKITAS